MSDKLPARNEKGQLLPGNTANPAGRPKVSAMAIIRDEIAKVPKGKKEALLVLMVRQYLDYIYTENDTNCMKDLISRLDGLPRATVEMQSDSTDEFKELLKSLMVPHAESQS